MAVSTKTWSPQTMGVEAPRPGRGAFHLTLVFSSQLTGGSPRGAAPVASGPRQWGQLSSRSAPAPSRAAGKRRKNEVASQRMTAPRGSMIDQDSLHAREQLVQR